MRERVAVVLGVWGVLAAHLAWVQPWTVDDAYVAYRYAENWAAGHGPVYNPGEWVEGYTSVAWVAVLALAHAVGLPTELTSKALGVACAAAVPVGLVLAPRFAPVSPRAGLAAALLAGCSGALVGWAAGGLEMSAAALVAQVAWAGHLAGARWTPLAAAVAGLVRPELALIPAVMVADHALARRTRPALAVLGAAAVVLGGHELARLWAYGWPLPNTFYAKVGATGEQLERGLAYLARFLLVGGGLLAPILGAPRLPRVLWAPAAWVGLHVAFVVAVGGDGLPAWRFFVPIVGVGALLSAAVLDGLRAAWLAVPLAAIQLAAIPLDPEQLAKMGPNVVSANGREVGEWLAAHAPPGAVLATNTAGSVPYFSRLVTIDMLGLCDAHIAHAPPPADMGARKAGHEKADGRYVLSRAPDIVLFGAARGRKDPFFRSDRELDRSPAFHRQYRLVTRKLPSGRPLVMWVRADRVDAFR